MSKYFMLECYGPDDQDRAGIDTVEGVDDVNWMLGKRITQPIPTPIKITMDADEGLMMPMFNRGILVLSDALIAVLREAGVDNLDLYETELFNPATNQRFTDYKAVNIIGAVAAADLGESQFQAHGKPLYDVDFESVKIDAKKARGLLLFRLAECVSGIVVHESVRKRVESRGIPYLDWVSPEEWVG